jgi:Type I restriction enzyme R protein N terminus (HSDR_N)
MAEPDSQPIPPTSPTSPTPPAPTATPVAGAPSRHAPGNAPGTVYDPVRKRQVAATPEEAVRQSVLRYLLDVLKAPANLIGVEYSLANLEPGNFRRVDIVVWRPGRGQLDPWLLVECKEPRVRIDDAVALQAGDYLKKIPCRFVMLCNGADSRYLERKGDGYKLVAGLPFFASVPGDIGEAETPNNGEATIPPPH